MCTKYDWKKYTAPFWKGNIVYNEAVYPVKSKKGSTTYNLMYTPDTVVSVYDAQFRIKYKEGRDYTVSGNTITFLTSGRIEIKEYAEIHNCTAAYSWDKRADGQGVEYDSGDVAKQYINVTYTHSDTWKGPVPKNQSSSLPKTTAAIGSKSHMNIVYYGDSICGGARASSFQGLYPYCEWWNQQVTSYLTKGMGMDIDATYASVGGSTAEDMSSEEKLNEYVYCNNPDLVVIEFGVNDAQNEAAANGNLAAHKAKYKKAVLSIMDSIRKKFPDCEFLLVTPFYSNIYLFNVNFPEYITVCRDALLEINDEVSGTAVADVTTVHNYLLGFKNFIDFSGDNLCHPNDYMSRIYSQICLEAIVPGGVDAYTPKEGGEISGKTIETNAAPGGHGWYMSEKSTYGYINNYGKNEQDITVTADICLLPASTDSCVHFFSNDRYNGIWVYPDHVQIGPLKVDYEWGKQIDTNWKTVSFTIKNKAASVTIDGELIASYPNGFTAYTDHQIIFSNHGSMMMDNLKITNSTGKVYLDLDFEDESAAIGHLGNGGGEYCLTDINTVQYNTNGGQGEIGNCLKVAGTPMPITSIVPTRNGYTFMGWSENKDASVADYHLEDFYTNDKSATLYAVWFEGIHTHSFGNWEIIEKPTCIKPGKLVRVCDCGQKDYTTSPATGHTESEPQIIPATCTENGKTLIYCTVCGAPISNIPIIATGHKYVNGVCTVCYAKDPSFNFKGDVDLNGKVNGQDLIMLKERIVGSSQLSPESEKNADMTDDDKLNAADVYELKKKITGAD